MMVCQLNLQYSKPTVKLPLQLVFKWTHRVKFENISICTCAYV
ncbi:conserved hypothetical protein [Pseudolactococcus piscium]|nr:conserved hypothetical protein [Lactococcus piscium]